MSVRSEKTVAPVASPSEQMAVAISDAQPTDANLAEGASFQTNSAENPLTRNVVVSVRASLNDLCLQKSKGNWAPSTEALRNVFQSRKFTSLDGSAEAQGDLKVRTLPDASSSQKSPFAWPFSRSTFLARSRLCCTT